MHGALYNWGTALLQEAGDLSGRERADKLADACAKFADALRIKPDKHEALNNWGNALLQEAGDLSGRKRAETLVEAEKLFQEAKTLSGLPSYNLACCYALQGNSVAALDELEARQNAGTLPTAEHLAQDSDLDSLRAEPRFWALLTPKSP
jgi:hypothetical protein